MMYLTWTMEHGCVHCLQWYQRKHLTRTSLVPVIYLDWQLFCLMFMHLITLRLWCLSKPQTSVQGEHSLSTDEAQHTQQSTVGQASNVLWLEQHACTITSSNFKKIISCQSAFTIKFLNSIFEQRDIGGGANGLMPRWTDGSDTWGSLTPIKRNGISMQSTCDTFWGKCHWVRKQKEGLFPYLNWCSSVQVWSPWTSQLTRHTMIWSLSWSSTTVQRQLLWFRGSSLTVEYIRWERASQFLLQNWGDWWTPAIMGLRSTICSGITWSSGLMMITFSNGRGGSVIWEGSGDGFGNRRHGGECTSYLERKYCFRRRYNSASTVHEEGVGL